MISRFGESAYNMFNDRQNTKKTKNPEAAEIVRHYKMSPHVEGGFYAETFRSPRRFETENLPAEFGGPRAWSTAIVYLLEEGDRSRLHRLRQEEVWHFYLGGPLTLSVISPEGRYAEIVLGRDFRAGQLAQYAVPAGFWFGAAPRPGAGFSFVGCTVAPGFDFADFEMAERERLKEKFPHLIADLDRCC